MAGVVVSTLGSHDNAIQAGAVFTHYQNRHKIDLDVVYQQGLDQRKNSARYDISWQYRMAPAEYPPWGIPASWYLVTEIGGRWMQGETAVPQFTLGLQKASRRWVFEVGLIRNIKISQKSDYLVSIRFH
ncbi:MAG: hypothetical protein HRU20_06065 [Pseudomonadales bacterium]|nr:hypothetical protein [Pseudomonadales bacterium]